MPVVNPRVSILIPIFNAENTLRDCLDSAARQSLEDIEIVCIDDACTDCSADIVRTYQQTDGRIKYLRHERNLGEGAARNTGIENSQGRYIFHLDADDTLPEVALERLWDTAFRNNSQMVKGGFSITAFNGRVIAENHEASKDVVINTCIRDSAFLQRIPVGHCTYLYERAFLNQNQLRYRTDMRVGLDLVALSAALVSAARVSLVPDVVYNYHHTRQSATRGWIRPDAVEQAIRAKALVCQNLVSGGFRQAARDYVKVWDWQLKALWANLPVDVPEAVLDKLFTAFRKTIPDRVVPWCPSSPMAHRYFLSLILLGRDSDARAFLQELRRGDPFKSHPDLSTRCSVILQVSPDDAQARECAPKRA